MTIRDQFSKAKWCITHPGDCTHLASNKVEYGAYKVNRHAGEAVSEMKAGTHRAASSLRYERERIGHFVRHAVGAVAPETADRMELKAYQKAWHREHAHERAYKSYYDYMQIRKQEERARKARKMARAAEVFQVEEACRQHPLECKRLTRDMKTHWREQEIAERAPRLATKRALREVKRAEHDAGAYGDARRFAAYGYNEVKSAARITPTPATPKASYFSIDDIPDSRYRNSYQRPLTYSERIKILNANTGALTEVRGGISNSAQSIFGEPTSVYSNGNGNGNRGNSHTRQGIAVETHIAGLISAGRGYGGAANPSWTREDEEYYQNHIRHVHTRGGAFHVQPEVQRQSPKKVKADAGNSHGNGHGSGGKGRNYPYDHNTFEALQQREALSRANSARARYAEKRLKYEGFVNSQIGRGLEAYGNIWNEARHVSREAVQHIGHHAGIAEKGKKGKKSYRTSPSRLPGLNSKDRKTPASRSMSRASSSHPLNSIDSQIDRLIGG